MATGSGNTNRASDDIVDSTPLMSSSNSPLDESRRSLRRHSLREAARFLRRASSRRMMREPSMLVRETAAEQLEERQSDWAYSKPVIVLDMIWNFAFVAVAFAVLVLSRNEMPSVPLRLWIFGYALQCLLHMVCVTVEFRRRSRGRGHVSVGEDVLDGGSSGDSTGSTVGRESGSQYVTLPQLEEGNSVAKHLESANTMFSFIWWIVGFYWVSAGGQALATDSPQLYWLCIVFLAFDVFFVVFCVALACVIGIAVCCCLPCIIAILYAVADQVALAICDYHELFSLSLHVAKVLDHFLGFLFPEVEGASKEEIEQLTKYKFRRIGAAEKLGGDNQGYSGGIMTECNTDTPTEHILSEEDAECCICLSSYDDGVELRELPCGHHFHCMCVDKWLFINATCPLCKYNILKSSNYDREEV